MNFESDNFSLDKYNIEKKKLIIEGSREDNI